MGLTSLGRAGPRVLASLGGGPREVGLGPVSLAGAKPDELRMSEPNGPRVDGLD